VSGATNALQYANCVATVQQRSETGVLLIWQHLTLDTIGQCVGQAPSKAALLLSCEGWLHWDCVNV
jgi:hypothetical protein